MNKIALALTLVCLPLAAAADSKPTTTAPVKAKATTAKSAKTQAATKSIGKSRRISAAEAAVIDKFVRLQDAAIATFLELGDTLAGVKDKESADAAAPTVRLAGEQLCTIISAVEALGEPSEATQQAIMSRVANVAEKKRIAEEVMEPMLTLMMQEPPCFGSEALHTEIVGLLANLQGAAGLDDEEVEEHADAAILQEPDADESDMQE